MLETVLYFKCCEDYLDVSVVVVVKVRTEMQSLWTLSDCNASTESIDPLAAFIRYK